MKRIRFPGIITAFRNMETLEDAYGALRDLQDARKQYEKEAGLFGEDRSREIAECDALEASARGRIVFLLEAAELEDALNVQNELVMRFAKRIRANPDEAAKYWEKSYAAKFRTFWNQDVREIPELEHLIFGKS